MYDIINPIQNTSYCDKDFESVYSELLTLAKKLTYKWDPSISNESDPGVVLLKLNAIIADKCNYNSDKNILECFPLSVSQERNARQLFNQLGYFMRWYRAATTNVVISWNSETTKYSYKIPAFTMITDDDSSIVYTLVGPAEGTTNETFIVADQNVEGNKSSRTVFKAIQGIAVQYDINGETTIKSTHLDSNNRIYFNSTNIAENGIFITNVGQNNYSDWVRKDNLVVESLGQCYYSFGITQDNSMCYIEFTEDASSLIKDGINITYIKTSGLNGNIAMKTLTKFYSDLSASVIESGIENGSTEILSSDNIIINNFYPATNGKDPESINDAYEGYKKTVGTFNTLVTLRDYINYIYNSELVSNCFVCDRSNDIQCTYDIISSINDVSQKVTRVEKLDGEEVLTAFSLKLYLLQATSDLSSFDSYSKTFNMITNSGQSTVKSYINDIKSMQHDYVDIMVPTSDASHICYFKNKYPLNCNITTKYSLNSTQYSDVVNNIKLALYENLNARKMDFGERISTDFVIDVIKNSDSRIKNVSLENIDYTTYAVYYETYIDDNGSTQHRFVDVDITSDSSETVTVKSSNEYMTFSCDYDSFVTKTKVSEADIYNTWESQHYQESQTLSQWLDMLDDYGITLETPTYENTEIYRIGDVVRYIDSIYSRTKFTGIPETQFIAGNWELVGPFSGDFVTARVSYKTQFRDEIYTKSVMAGVTPIFIQDDQFNYSLRQTYKNMYDNIYSMRTNANIVLSQDTSITSGDHSIYKVKENESVQFYAPNLIESTEYSNYVKFEYKLNNKIDANMSYELGENEFIIFYWKETSDTDAIYKYYAYSKGNVFKPTFEIPAYTGGLIGASLVTPENLHNIGTASNPILVSDSNYNGEMTSELSNKIAELTSSFNILSSSKSITKMVINTIELDSSYNCYWTLNSTDESGDRYVLFDADNETTERILEYGEYFFYTNSEGVELGIVGAGTRLIRSNTASVWSVNVLDSETIFDQGASALNNYWYSNISDENKLKITENQYVIVGNGYEIKINTVNPSHTWSYKKGIVTAPFTVNDFNVDRTKWFASTYGNSTGDLIFKYKRLDDGTYTWTTNGNIVTDMYEEYGITFKDGLVIHDDDSIKIMVRVIWDITISSTGYSIGAPKSGWERYASPDILDFSIKYKLVNEEEWTSLDSLSLYEYDWDVRSLLSLSCTSSEDQILLGNQEVYLKRITDPDTEIVIKGADKKSDEQLGFSYYPVCLMSSMRVNVTGSGEVSTYVINDDGEYKYTSLYVFAKALDSEDKRVSYTDDGDIALRFDGTTTTNYFKFKVPKGTYIIPLNNSHDEITKLTLQLDPDDPTRSKYLHAIYDENLTNFASVRKHYIYLEMPDEVDPLENHVMKVTCEGQLNQLAIILNKCFKYDKSTSITDPYFNKIVALIQKFDTYNDFDYTTQIDSSYVIEDPLLSSSFLNVNHIYNDNTICQINSINIK